MNVSDLDKAEASLSTSMRHVQKPSWADQKIHALVDGTQSQSSALIRDEAMAVFSNVKSQLGTFVQGSLGLRLALDELGKIHPFVQIAVIPFKVALAFELNRRENDKKVLALFVQMSDMMKILRLLEPIKPSELGDEGNALADRMKDRLKSAADVIQECSHATNEYYKAKFIPKLIKCSKWEEKFAGYAKAFTNFTNDLQSDLQIFTGTGVQVLKKVIDRVDQKIDMVMKLVFETLASPEEQELSKFVGNNGGPDKFKDNDKLLKDLMRKRQDQVKRRFLALPRGHLASQPEDSFKEIKEEVRSDLDLDAALKESRKLFDQNFEEQRHRFEEVKSVVRRESDRIIEQIRSGAHDRIRDKVIYHIWMDMGWKGSIKARHLVLALRDFYVDHLHRLASSGQANSEINDISNNANVESPSNRLQEISQEMGLTTSAVSDDDRWAIGYISIFRLRPLLEALDSDYSGLVTITEVNDFTAARPEDWTLPRWLAYWTVGFHITLKQYCYRIREVFSALASTYSTLLPGNTSVSSEFFNAYQLTVVDQLVAGIYTAHSDYGDYGHDYQHLSFKNYVANNERRLKRNLKSYEYCIDDINMTLISGPGRLEEHVLPLIYLVLRHALQIMAQGESILLPPSAFEVIFRSLNTIWFAVNDRTHTLQGAFKLLNLGVQDGLRKYCHGLYYYFTFSAEMDEATSYYNMPGSEVDPIIDTDDSNDDELDSRPAEKPFSEHEALRTDLPDTRAYEEMTNPNPTLESEGLVGDWNGFYYYGSSKATDGMMGFRIDNVNANGSVTGGGSDALGDFSITGIFRSPGPHMTFLKVYLQPQRGEVMKWFYDGVVSEDCNDINGNWGPPREEQGEDIEGPVKEQFFLGTFRIQRRSVAYIRFHPSDEVIQENKAKALWKFALDSTLHERSNRGLRWSALKTRRDQRQRFITLFMRWEEFGPEGEDAEEYDTLCKSVTAADIRYYRSLADLFRSRKVIHNAKCDGCYTEIDMTRSICIDCSGGHCSTNPVDLCSNCVQARKEFTVTRRRDNGVQQLKHTPSHRLLQVRRPLPKRQRYNAWEKVSFTPRLEHCEEGDTGNLETEQQGSRLHCIECSREAKSPCWTCGDCDQTYICMDCNVKIERDRPWLFERRNTKNIPYDNERVEGEDREVETVDGQFTKGEDGDSDISNMRNGISDDLENEAGSQKSETEIQRAARIATSPAKHPWSHDLILCQPPVPITSTVTVEERLVKLETTLQEQKDLQASISSGVKDMSDRLGRLESLLSRLVDRGS